MATFRAACLQVNASDDMDANLRVVAGLARRARDEGAEFITTPENVSMMTTGSASLRSASLKSRPATIGTPSAAKKPGDTVRNRARGSSSPFAFA